MVQRRIFFARLVGVTSVGTPAVNVISGRMCTVLADGRIGVQQRGCQVTSGVSAELNREGKHMIVSGFSGNELYCLAQKGWAPGGSSWATACSRWGSPAG